METVGTVKPGMGKSVAVVGIDTKYGHNAASMLRSCSALGAGQLWLTGNRWDVGWEKRMPREERMKAYQDVEVYRAEQPLRAFSSSVRVVAIEVVRNAIPLALYEHPEDAVYVFGPEDGSLPKGIRLNCHDFVILPTDHCLNLATAVTCTLMHRRIQRQLAGKEPIQPSAETLRESRGWLDADDKLSWAWEGITATDIVTSAGRTGEGVSGV